MRRFYIDRESIRSDRSMITGPDVRHIRTVLRLGPGDEIFLFDGQGSEYRARIIDSTSRAITLLVLYRYSSTSESHLELTIGQALLKARKMDRIVRQLTELGAVGFIPFFAQRSVPRPKIGRLAERECRWETIAREALKQCCRSKAPRVGPVVSFEDLISSDQSYDYKIIFHNCQYATISKSFVVSHRHLRKVLALVGPEGGFTDRELKFAVDSGFACIFLGPRVLKSDTAAVAAVAILQHTFGDMGGVQKDLDKD